MKEKLFTRNFVLLIFGQASSLFGNSILRLALSMYILDRTGSAALFGGVLSVAVIPTILLSPLGGFLADRMDRRNLMVLLDALTGSAVLLTALALSRRDSIAPVVWLLVFLSVLGAFETPTVQACIPSMLSGDNIVRGNAVVSQAAAISGLTAPALGGLLYAAFGLLLVMYTSVLCFFATAASECFIRLDHRPPSGGGGLLSMVRQDLSLCIRYLCRERPGILKLLLLAALSNFFVMGAAAVGFPYLVRMVLGLDARYYGAAESALAVAALGGSIAAGSLVGKLRTGNLFRILAALGGVPPARRLDIPCPGRRDPPVSGQPGLLLRDAGGGQPFLPLHRLPDPAGHAKRPYWEGDGLHLRHRPVRPAPGAAPLRLFVRTVPGSGPLGAAPDRGDDLCRGMPFKAGLSGAGGARKGEETGPGWFTPLTATGL